MRCHTAARQHACHATKAAATSGGVGARRRLLECRAAAPQELLRTGPT